MHPPELKDPSYLECGRCGSTRAAGNGRTACLCSTKEAAPVLTYESAVPEDFYVLIQYRFIAHAVIAKALDDSVGILRAYDRHVRRQDPAKLMRAARQWLVTPSESRKLWFEVAGLSPPKTLAALQVGLTAWLRFRESTMKTRMVAFQETMKYLYARGDSVD